MVASASVLFPGAGAEQRVEEILHLNDDPAVAPGEWSRQKAAPW
jgi:hypothetical protein